MVVEKAEKKKKCPKAKHWQHLCSVKKRRTGKNTSTRTGDNGRKFGLLDVPGLTEESLREGGSHVTCYRGKSTLYKQT